MKISLIVLEYQSLKEIKRFVDNISPFFLCVDFEIIVSSNSQYSQELQNTICDETPNAKWKFNKLNGGFAYGMNEGLKIASGEILIISNSDVKIESSLEPMITYLMKHPEVGIIAPKIIDEGGIIQDSFRSFVTPFSFVRRQIGRIIHHNKLHVMNFNEPKKVDWLIGAFMMVRRDFYEKIGGLSEDYFMYCEDEDWCKRAHLAGYDVVYYPETVVEYKGTRASRRSWKYAKIHFQSLMTYWRKFGFFCG